LQNIPLSKVERRRQLNRDLSGPKQHRTSGASGGDSHHFAGNSHNSSSGGGGSGMMGMGMYGGGGKKLNGVKKERDPKCSRCSVHGEDNKLKGHKKETCPWKECGCQKVCN
jgi:hypothetical protein